MDGHLDGIFGRASGRYLMGRYQMRDLGSDAQETCPAMQQVFRASFYVLSAARTQIFPGDDLLLVSLVCKLRAEDGGGFRCADCSKCLNCKTSSKRTAITLREAREQQLIEESVSNKLVHRGVVQHGTTRDWNSYLPGHPKSGGAGCCTMHPRQSEAGQPTGRHRWDVGGVQST